MKAVWTLLAVLTLAGCMGSHETKKEGEPEIMALGWMSRTGFMNSTYPAFQTNYDTSTVSPDFTELIKTLHNDIEVVVVLGTWCKDSKRDVPRFLHIADAAQIPETSIRYYGVDRSKKSPDGVTEQYAIEFVPTFIFLKNGMEVGRIVEAPKNSLEEDILTILADAQNK